MKHQITQLLEDDGAVSPVIGVILMVAITVILAAVIGTFVLGLGDQVSQTAPQASIEIQSVEDTADHVTFKHGGGDPITLSETKIVFKGPSNSSTVTFSSGTFSTAETKSVASGLTLSSGTQYTATWVDVPSGQVIAELTFTGTST